MWEIIISWCCKMIGFGIRNEIKRYHYDKHKDRLIFWSYRVLVCRHGNWKSRIKAWYILYRFYIHGDSSYLIDRASDVLKDMAKIHKSFLARCIFLANAFDEKHRLELEKKLQNANGMSWLMNVRIETEIQTEIKIKGADAFFNEMFERIEVTDEMIV